MLTEWKPTFSIKLKTMLDVIKFRIPTIIPNGVLAYSDPVKFQKYLSHVL
jgi:hypothetical protein